MKTTTRSERPDPASADKATRETATFWMALACVVAAIALVYLFLRSKQGLALLVFVLQSRSRV